MAALHPRSPSFMPVQTSSNTYVASYPLFLLTTRTINNNRHQEKMTVLQKRFPATKYFAFLALACCYLRWQVRLNGQEKHPAAHLTRETKVQSPFRMTDEMEAGPLPPPAFNSGNQQSLLTCGGMGTQIPWKPRNPPVMDFFIRTWEGDGHWLIYMLRSIEKFVPPTMYRDIIICFAKHEEEFFQSYLPYFSVPVRLVPEEDVYINSGGPNNGSYYSQMYSKLMVGGIPHQIQAASHDLLTSILFFLPFPRKGLVALGCRLLHPR